MDQSGDKVSAQDSDRKRGLRGTYFSWGIAFVEYRHIIPDLGYIIEVEVVELGVGLNTRLLRSMHPTRQRPAKRSVAVRVV